MKEKTDRPLIRGTADKERQPKGDGLLTFFLRLMALGSVLMVCASLLAGCAGAPLSSELELRREAIALNEAGYRYYRQDRWQLAQEKFRQALKLNRLIDHRGGIAANLNNLGVLAQERGDYQKAQAYFQEALGLQRQLADEAGICEALNNLGAVYQAQGRWGEAREFYQEARHYARMLPPGALLSLTLTRLGDVARHDRDYPKALSFYQEALAIDEDIQDGRGRAVRWERLGRTSLAVGNYNQANRLFLQALAEARRRENTQTIVDALDGLLLTALAQGDRGAARSYGERLIELYKVRGQEKEARRVEELLGKTRAPR